MSYWLIYKQQVRQWVKVDKQNKINDNGKISDNNIARHIKVIIYKNQIAMVAGIICKEGLIKACNNACLSWIAFFNSAILYFRFKNTFNIIKTIYITICIQEVINKHYTWIKKVFQKYLISTLIYFLDYTKHVHL